MSHSPLRRRSVAAILGVLSLAACGTPEARSAASAPASVKGAAVASGGEVTGGGLAPGLSDSVSTLADKGRIRGAETAKVWLIEVSDFQCPYCKRWHDDSYAALDREYVQTGKARIAYINYPIARIHPNARAASEAAMCSSAQNRFWQMHDALFDTQARWAPMQNPMPMFDSLAVAAGVNPTAWRSCMSTHATIPLIDADRDRWGQAGVTSTPSFFVANRALVGAYPTDSFRVVLDSAIAAQAKGTR